VTESHDPSLTLDIPTNASWSRWTVAAMLALLVHGAATAALLEWPLKVAAAEPLATLTIELAPSLVAPEVPLQETAPGPQMSEAQQAPSRETLEDPEEKPDPKAKATDQKPIAEVPKLPEDHAKADIPVASKQPAKKPPPQSTKVESEKPLKPQKHAAPQTRAPRVPAIRHAERAAAPLSASAQMPSMSSASWYSLVAAHLNRFSASSSTGAASVSYVVDRSGRVVSSRLVQSSGDRALDAQAVAVPRRASPVPAPPASVSGSTIRLNTRIVFR
jgi:periplasmic protein TonB